MALERCTLHDRVGREVGVLHVEPRGELYLGTAEMSSVTPGLVRLFVSYEESVNGQMLSIVDQIESSIAALELRVRFRGEPSLPALELQLYPSTAGVSFRIGPKSG